MVGRLIMVHVARLKAWHLPIAASRRQIASCRSGSAVPAVLLPLAQMATDRDGVQAAALRRVSPCGFAGTIRTAVQFVAGHVQLDNPERSLVGAPVEGHAWAAQALLYWPYSTGPTL
jgi:hypothetical protein